MTDDLKSAALEAKAPVREFVLGELAKMYEAGGDPEPFAVALLGQAAGLMRVLKGPEGAAVGLVEMAIHIARLEDVAHRA